MLIFHDCSTNYTNITPDLKSSALPPRVVWIDIIEGSVEEIGYIERATGMHIPSIDELSEIENSSRLRSEQGALCMSMPTVFRNKDGAPEVTALGFILTRNLLITVRFAPLVAFTAFAQQLAKPDNQHNSATAFAGLADAIIDRVADVLEEVGSELDRMSRRIFRTDALDSTVPQRTRPARERADLRDTLRRIGRNGDLASKIRDSLLGLGRIVPYVANVGGEWLPAEIKPRLETQRLDIISLSDYDAHLSNKVQLLLDATLGLINIEQNNIIKVLTIVSVVGVPPTLIASMYGMNFRHMPELDWAWGYPYGLALIALSAVAPIVWFKIRGWL